MTTPPVTAQAHYDALLAEWYTWMLGPPAERVRASRDRLEALGLRAGGASHAALDLGAGPGHDALALAQLGYSVVAVDTSARLLEELERSRGDLPITTVRADLREFRAIPDVAATIAAGGFGVVACLGDTLTHLDRIGEVERLLDDAAAALAPGGTLLLTFRDLTGGAVGDERELVTRDDPDRRMTCRLRIEHEHVLVRDTVHERVGGGWQSRESAYRKLRVAPRLVVARLQAAGLTVDAREGAGGLWTVVARRG